MKIQPNLTSNKDKSSFKSKLTFDIGASDPRASLKILVQNNNGDDLFEYKGFVNDSIKGFENNTDFIKKVANAADVETLINKDITNIQKSLKEDSLTTDELKKSELKLEDLKLKQKLLQNRSASEKKLTGFALLLPGTIQGKIALFMANLKKTDKTSLTNVNLADIITEIKTNPKIEVAKTFDTAKNFMPCKDLAGTGIGIAQKIANHPDFSNNFKKGFFATAVQTGGGFGAADIKFKEDNFVEIETNESGHDLFYDRKIRKEQRLGKLGASTKSVIENYAKKFGITNPTDQKILIETGMAQIATQQKVKFNNEKDKNAISILLKTNGYEIADTQPEFTTLRVRKDKVADFAKASTYAIKAYADTLAIHAITKINQGVNLYVVSGPLAMGLNDRIKEDPKLFGAKDMKNLILKLIDKRVAEDLTCSLLRKSNNFDIVCDKALCVDNNTSGGALLLSKNARTIVDRGEWMKVPLKVLKSAI